MIDRPLLLLGLLRLVHLEEQLLDLGVPFLVLLAEAAQLVVRDRDLGVETHDGGIRRELGHGVQRLVGRLELGDLLEGRLQADAAGLGLDEVGGELGDRAGHGGGAALRHEQVLALVALEEAVLGLAHALLGGAQALLQPLVGLARRFHARGDRVLDVDVGERVGPERRFLRIAVRHVDHDQPALRHRLHVHVGHELPARVPVLGRVLELEPVQDLLAERARAQDAELGVVEVRVLPVAAAERLLDAHERRRGRVDLHHHAGAVLRRLREGDREPQAEPEDTRGGEEDAVLPEEVAVVAEVDRAFRLSAAGHRTRRSHG